MKKKEISNLFTKTLFIAVVSLLAAAAGAAQKKTTITGTENYLGFIDPGIQMSDGQQVFISDAVGTAKDTISDARLSGDSVITVNGIWNLPMVTGPTCGAYGLTNSGGEWFGYWAGTRTVFTDSTGPHIRSTLWAVINGSAGYAGLVARIDLIGIDVMEQGNPFAVTGYILEGRGGTAQRPISMTATREDHLQIYPSMVLPPSDPPVYGAMGVWQIVSETGVVSHVGLAHNQGMGLVNPLTGVASGTGAITAANGDQIFWVVEGTSELGAGVSRSTVHLTGGTGRFEAAFGELSGTVRETFTPVTPPWEFTGEANYRLSGWIRY